MVSNLVVNAVEVCQTEYIFERLAHLSQTDIAGAPIRAEPNGSKVGEKFENYALCPLVTFGSKLIMEAIAR